MADVLAAAFMDGVNETKDEVLRQELISKTANIPSFLEPTVMMLLESCCPMNSVPKLPANLLSR
ncbi:unnamed protein product, partial [Gongylonema pulchrum]|uniref:Serine/threonine-protein kinase ATR n=1 Tax=Gongylonema pulchrum TaxID=637853 RepID=A0A183EWV1_9BILA